MTDHELRARRTGVAAEVPSPHEPARRRTNPQVYAELLARAREALARSLSRMSPDVQKSLLAAPAAEDVLVKAALQPTVVERITSRSPLLPALLRGAQEKRWLLAAEGGTLSGGEVAELLGVTRQAIDKQRRARKLLALRVGKAWRYPAWQFADGQPLPGLDTILGALRGTSLWSVTAFLLGRNVRLKGRRPLDLLRGGEVDPVDRAARAYGAHGAA